MAVTVLTDGAVTEDTRTLTWTIPTLATGDWVVVAATTWDSGVTLNAPSGTGLTFTERANVSASARPRCYLWTAQASSGGSSVAVTCSVAAGGASHHSGVLYRFPTADGYSIAGTPNVATKTDNSGTPLSIALSGASGSIGVFNGADWTGVTTSPTWLGDGASDLNSLTSGSGSQYYGRQTLTGSSTTVGMSAPNTTGGQAIAAIEVVYTAPAGINGYILHENNDRILYENGTDLLVSEDFVGGGQSQALPVVTETDTIVALGRSKSKALPTDTETDTAQALARAKRRALPTTTEADSLLALGRTKVKTVGVVTETDTPVAPGRTKRRTLGAVSETDTASILSRLKARALAVVSEASSAITLARAKSKALPLVGETDTVGSVVRAGGMTQALPPVSETDSAVALGRAKRKTAPVVTEADSTVTVGRTKRKTLPLANESDTPVALTSRKTKALPVVSEVSAVVALVRRKARALATVVETSSALLLGRRKTRTVPTVTEVDTAGDVALAVPTTDFEGRILAARLSIPTATGSPSVPEAAAHLSTVAATADLDVAEASAHLTIAEATGVLS